MVRGRKRQYPKLGDKITTSPSLNNNIIKDDGLGYVNETLDFEPDELEDATDSEISTDQNNLNLKPFTASFTSEMISLNSIKFPDGRQREYIPVPRSNHSSRIMIDSTSDSSSTSSLKKSYRENEFGSELNEDGLENESLCSISADDENKLLESTSEDEIDEEETESPFMNNFFKNKVVVAQNNRIIIQTGTALFNANDRELKSLESKTHPKKKKKWDISSRYPPIELSLQDIGYTSQSDEDAADSVVSRDCPDSNTITSFKVTCSDKERVCRQIQKVSSHSRLSVSSDETNFKVPLPPVKRPPSRPRRQDSVDSSNSNDEFPMCSIRSYQASPLSLTILNDNHSNSSGQTNKDGKIQEDDSISLIASTFGGNDILEDGNESIKEEPASSHQKYLNTQRLGYVEQQHDYLAERRPFVLNWVENVPNDPPSEWDDGLGTSQEQQLEESVVATTTRSKLNLAIDVNGKRRLNFKDVPIFFRGLCYYQYINGKCTRYCNQAHLVVRDKFVMRCKLTKPEELLNAYQFSLKIDALYKDLHLCFVVGFGHHKMQTELVACIKDFFRFEQIIDVPYAIEETVGSLENTGLTFLETVDKISFNMGFMQYPLLANILLELVTRKKGNLSDNWEMIKRICKAKETIPANIARRILVSSVSGSYPYNTKLCLEVYDVIIKNKATDLTQIEETILAPFRTLASFKRGIPDQLYAQNNQLFSAGTCNTKSTITGGNLVAFPSVSQVETQSEAIDDQPIQQKATFERSSQQLISPTLPARQLCHANQNYVPREYIPPIPSLNVAMTQPVIREQQSEDERDSEIPIQVFEDTPINFNSMKWTPPNSSIYVDEDVASKCDTVYSQPEFLEYHDLFPSCPVIGKRCYNKHFKREISLHNLLCNPMDLVDMHETDVKKLNTAIKKSMGELFVGLMYKYSRKETVTNFITMTLAILKSCDKISQVFDSLLVSLAQYKLNFTKIREVKGTLEVIVMNILFEYERRALWKEAAILIERFCDWDSLVSSKIFSIKQMTDMGKYLYLAKMLVLGEKIHLASGILQCPNLRMLDLVEKWPYFCHAYADMEFRNTVLNNFFDLGFRYNIIPVLTMYSNSFKNGGISKYNIQEKFNSMLIKLIDEEQLPALKYVLKDIDIFYKEMERNIFRAFTVIIESQIFLQEQKFRLYEFCCQKNIYTSYKGDETNIIVRVNMLDVEIRFILLYFFNKLSARPNPPSMNTGISIDIKLQDCESVYPKILVNTLRSIKQVNDSVRTILSECFELPVCNTESTSCVISPSAVTNWWQSNRRWS